MLQNKALMASIIVAPYMGAWIEIRHQFCTGLCILVAPYMGAWIEIGRSPGSFGPGNVAPYMGAWIEIVKNCRFLPSVSSLPTWGRGLKLCAAGLSLPPALSLPTWGRGLKYQATQAGSHARHVAPYMGAWIEIFFAIFSFLLVVVAPYMGAWIEMPLPPHSGSMNGSSLPTWGRGLKLINGAHSIKSLGRSLHGGVD